MPSPYETMQEAEIVVIDDAPSSRTECRAICAEALEHAHCVILLTREPIDDHLVHVELCVTSEDLQVVAETLRTLTGQSSVSVNPQPGLLWNLLRVDLG